MKVTYIDHMGSDLSVVNAARVSFGKESEWEYDYKDVRMGSEWDSWERVKDEKTKRLSERDSKLINYLAKHGHWTPFGHTAITLHIKAPIFVARQLGKHQVGLVWNEVSRRYIDSEPEFYEPETWRMKAENVKQGSSEIPVTLDGLQKCKNCQSELTFLREEDKKMKVYCSSKCQSEFYRRKTPEDWARTRWSKLKQSALKRDITFELTPDDLIEIGQPTHCKYLEIELDYAAPELQSNSPSVNRIDPNRGYEKDNIEIISNMANSMLLNADKETLKKFVKNTAIHQFGVFFNSAPSVSSYYDKMQELYRKLIDGGLCAEQARMFMPQSQYCEWYWTGNLKSFANVYLLRTDDHAQKETQEVAEQIGEIIEPFFPISWSALTNG